MRIGLVATDVDGTILPFGGTLSPRTLAAVRACEVRKIPFVIASGRWYVAAKNIADALGQKDGYLIIANGGAVTDLNGAPLKEWTLSPEAARRAYALMRRYDVMMNAFVRDAVYRVNTRAVKREIAGLGDYLGGRYHMRNDDPVLFEERGLDHPYKLEAYGDDPEALARLKRDLTEAGYSVSSAYADNLEIMDSGCGKGTAVRWLAERLGTPLSECMAFGDNLNDVQMLQTVGWPVAVGNAVDEAKAAARVIAPDCAEDGVAITLEKVLRGEDL